MARKRSALKRIAKWLFTPAKTRRRPARRPRAISKRARGRARSSPASTPPVSVESMTPAEIRALMKSGQLRFRNPSGVVVRLPKKLSSADKGHLAKARRLAQQFHGGLVNQIVELTPAERRQKGRFGVVVGELANVVYSPRKGSKRAGVKWDHASGDRGRGKQAAKNKPLLVVDPRTMRASIVHDKSGMKFSSKRGLVG